MSKTPRVSQSRSSGTGLLGGLTHSLEAKVAPFLARRMPERYGEIYRETLSASLEQLPVLAGLPPASMARHYLPLRLSPLQDPTANLLPWDALSQSSRVLILGPVGSGKSAMLRHLAWRFAGQIGQSDIEFLTFKLFGKSVPELKPILVDLRQLGESRGTLIEAMVASMAEHGFPGAEGYVQARLANGECIVLLDGLDAWGGDRAASAPNIAELASRYPGNIWVVAARPRPDLPPLERFVAFWLEGLDEADMERCVGQSVSDPAKAEGLLAACERSASMAQLARNPLMTAAVCRLVARQSDDAPRLPPLYDACLDTLLGEWAAGKGHSPRYQAADQLRVLQQIAYEIQERGEPGLESEEVLAIVRDALAEGKRGYAEDLFEELTLRSGLLSPTLSEGERRPTSRYDLFLPALRSYLAAQWVVSTDATASLLPHTADPWWQDTIVLASGLLDDPTPLMREIASRCPREPHKWLLLAGCIAECEAPDAGIVGQVEDRLYALFEREEDGLWQRAAAAIAGMARRRARRFFCDLCRNGRDPAERRRAALVLGRLGQDWAIPALGSAISDPDPSVRQQAAWALGHIPSSQAVGVLPRALRSAHAGVRQAAATALAKQGQSPELTESVVSQLIAALDPDRETQPDVAHLAEQALVQVGKAATPQLLAALDSKKTSPAQRSLVARTLGRLGDQRALPSLIDAILQGQAARSGDVSGLEGYIEAVACVGAEAVPALIAALEGKDLTTSVGLVSALGRIGEPAVGPLIEAIAGNSPEVRNAAVRALEQVGAPAIEPLTKALLVDTRYEVRRRALEILGRIGEEHVVAALIRALDDADIGVRINAARHLGNLKITAPASREAAVPKLVSILAETRAAEPQAPAERRRAEGAGPADIGPELTLRRTAITTLGAIGDPLAIPALLGALAEFDLNTAAANALAQFGEAVVVPIVVALHAPRTRPEIRRAAWDVLETVGARARPEEESSFGLASVYAALRKARGAFPERPGAVSPSNGLTDEEIVALTGYITWWEYGNEIHNSLSTARDLAQAKDLKEIGGCRAYFDWMTDPGYQGAWLRDHVREALWGFRDVVDSINVFQSLTRRDRQRNSLVSAIDRLEQVRQLIGPEGPGGFLPFEQQVLGHVVSQWHEIVLDAVKMLRGRASLLIDLLTPVVPMRKSSVVGTAVFQIFNEGDSAARNFWVSLRPGSVRGDGVEVVNGERVNLNPLGIGEQRRVEIGIAPRRAERASLMFEATYDDDERQGVKHQYGFDIRFIEAPDTYVPIERSPYIVGMPVKTKEMFFGRQDIFEWVRENVSGKYQEQALLLYGERRMGKTSVLYQLLNNPPTPQHICLLFDLQLYGYVDTVNELLFELASAICMRLFEEGIACEDPEWADYAERPQRAFTEFCARLDRVLGERRLLIMLDEFGVLIAKVRDHILESSVFDYIRGIIQRSERFTFLFTGAYEVRRMQQDFNSILFNMPKVRKISYLTEGEVNDLILKPVEGMLTYHPLVVPTIRQVTAGHPYFTQYICDELVIMARKQQTNYIELPDLEFVIHNVLQDAAGNIENSIYNYLDKNEKLVLAVLANVTDDVRVYVPLADIMRLLEAEHIEVSRDEVIKALQALIERDLVREMSIGQQLRYSFRMGLTRMWLRENDILLRWIQEQEA
ncbi:MAG: hypothetical protein FJZ90_00130 [Chloroflexi bacterium]|nr:hypothetical protein [Chloroflexota bacterium]